MYTLSPPAKTKPAERIVLKCSGATALPDFDDPRRRVRVATEEEARELERAGWTRDENHNKKTDPETLRKVVTTSFVRSGLDPIVSTRVSVDALKRHAEVAEIRHFDGQRSVGDHPRRIVVGEVDAGRFGRIYLEHDQGGREIVLHNIHVQIDDIDDEKLRASLLFSTAAFMKAESDQEEQTAIRTIIGITLAAILEKDHILADSIQRKQHRVRR
jgi:hypothetical protein